MSGYFIILCWKSSVTIFFFFSSRRRHTRLVSDWSSDVCSSDLPGASPRRVDVDGSLVVGRDCEGVVVVDPKVSRRHFVLRSIDHTLTVADLGSRNGTYVNGAAAEIGRAHV